MRQGQLVSGFGVELYDWVLPIFSKITKVEKRLILSACLLHDTIWSAHPDYRSELCVETVTRANMGGVDHTGRLFGFSFGVQIQR